MSSGDIKEILHTRFDTWRASGDWKRVSKKSLKDAIGGKAEIRIFEHDTKRLGQVVTMEQAGVITILEGDALEAMRPTLEAAGVTVPGSEPAAASEDAAPAPVKAAKPAKEPAAKTPNKKALMKKGTKWRVTEDCTIPGWVDNPAYYETMRALDAKRISGPPRIEALQKVGKSMKIDVAKLKAGTILTVDGKLVADLDNSVWFNGGKKTEGNGHGVPFRLKIGDNELLNVKVHQPVFPGHLPYLQPGEIAIYGDEAVAVLGYKFVEPYVELEGEAAEQFIYLLRDKATGLYYKMPNHDARHYVVNPAYELHRQEREKITGPHGPNFNRDAGYKWDETHPSPPYGGNKLKPGIKPEECFEWADKSTRAKQYADMGKMKSSILTFVGYHNGLEETDEMDGWMRETIDRDQDEGYPFLPTFEAVKMEKFSKREVEIIDIQSWYERTIRLRRITARFGSSVRGLYNKLDKAGDLEAYPYVVVFKTGKKDQWDDKSVDLTPEQLAAIDETVTQLGQTPKSLKKTKGPGTLSVAVADLGLAMGMKMGVDDLQAAIFDLNTMQEMVEQ